MSIELNIVDVVAIVGIWAFVWYQVGAWFNEIKNFTKLKKSNAEFAALIKEQDPEAYEAMKQKGIFKDD